MIIQRKKKEKFLGDAPDAPDASIHFRRKVCIIVLSLSDSPILTVSLKTKLTCHYTRHQVEAMS